MFNHFVIFVVIISYIFYSYFIWIFTVLKETWTMPKKFYNLEFLKVNYFTHNMWIIKYLFPSSVILKHHMPFYYCLRSLPTMQNAFDGIMALGSDSAWRWRKREYNKELELPNQQFSPSSIFTFFSHNWLIPPYSSELLM